MRFTVFTPTYNRGYIIENLFRSLQRQTFRDFEWVVVDDGSTDNTRELFLKFENENNDFEIIYQKVENGGKHRAINLGLQKARGELFFIVDSDDYLTDNALERISNIEETILPEQKSQFGGVCGQRGHSATEGIGSTFQGNTLDITTLERDKNGITGDKAEVFYTAILRQYPFPEFDGEKFVTECVVWDKIAYEGYKLRFFNEVVYICDYLPDGLSAHYQEALQNSPKGWGLYLHQSDIFGKISGLVKWNQYINYYYTYRKMMPFWQIAENLHMNPIRLYLRFLGMRLYYKLYDR